MNPDLVSCHWPDSLWRATAIPLVPLPALTGSAETRVGIVGAGYTGLSTALHLAEQGVESVVIDRNQPGWGCSGRNGGQVNPCWKVLPDDMGRHYGADAMAGVIRMANATCDLVFQLVDRYNIDCQAIRPGYILAVIGEPGRRYIGHWISQWQVAGSLVETLDRERMARMLGTDHYDCGMLDRRGGSVQPLSYARGLAGACLGMGVTIHGDSAALGVERRGAGWRIRTSGGAVDCESVVFATNGYSDRLWPGLRENIVPVASLISATEPLPPDVTDRITPDRNAVSDTAGLPVYYRIDEAGRMVFGGRGTLFGRTGSVNTGAVRRAALRLYPVLGDFRWEYDWGGYVAMTTHHRPLLLELDEGVYAGLGYNGRGVAMATMMGRLLAERIAEGRTGLPAERSRPIPLHAFHPVGIAGRMVGGRLKDLLAPRIRG